MSASPIVPPSPVLRAPFPYFGGKRKVASEVWARFGDVRNYVEPFAGSLAVLLARPTPPQIETINELDPFVSNFWRAMRAAPQDVARWADYPVIELDLHSRHKWLVTVGLERIATRLEPDPEFYDAQVAGWWAWGKAAWIAGGWCEGKRRCIPFLAGDGKGIHSSASWRCTPNIGGAHTGQGLHATFRQRPAVSGMSQGQGIHPVDPLPGKKIPNLTPGRQGTGVHRKRPMTHGTNPGMGVHREGEGFPLSGERLLPWFVELADRLRRVRVIHGDWSRVCTPAVTVSNGITGVFLDPPYSHAVRDAGIYAIEDDCSAAVRVWALEHGDDPRYRIALCGYEGEHEMPDSWEEYAWQTSGGYALLGKGRGRENAKRERIWFSPHCLRPSQVVQQLNLFGEGFGA